jgi:undecaprenyl diphosphate synthase
MLSGAKTEITIPAHIAIIMDGNGRWARSRRLPRRLGHQEGLKALRRIVEQCAKLKVSYLTVFAFSSENWNRPEREIKRLMELFFQALDKEISILHKNNVQVRFAGDLTAFAPEMQQKMRRAEHLTRNNDRLIFNIACNYGGRWDITQACRALARDVELGKIDPVDVNEDTLASYLDLAGIPDPDLLVRTGGEQRLSNFLLWQMAYSELYFSDVLWPDFDEKCLNDAILVFQQRERRFGRTSDQVSEARSA